MLSAYKNFQTFTQKFTANNLQVRDLIIPINHQPYSIHLSTFFYQTCLQSKMKNKEILLKKLFQSRCALITYLRIDKIDESSPLSSTLKVDGKHPLKMLAIINQLSLNAFNAGKMSRNERAILSYFLTDAFNQINNN